MLKTTFRLWSRQQVLPGLSTPNVDRILLIRNGESTANVDIEEYCRTPDWKVDLTPSGVRQAHAAGTHLASTLNGAPVYVYFSPYLRSVQSMKALLASGKAAPTPLNIVGVREDARLRDGDIGTYQGGIEELKKCIADRELYGKFFYRFPNGESGADVYDRVTSFLDAFQREKQKLPQGTTVAIVTHGLTIRLFIKRWFHLNVDTFHSMVSPPPGHSVELVRVGHDEHSFMLSESDLNVLSLPKSLSEANGYANRNKRALGSVSIGAPYV